ncbi:MAG: hypothetical protein JSW14_03215 [Candidatus Bathyarchaeum sp.]|nr:MAG: hypothetical protein JSW14_03215 [Candidatus Bathyarchaeum sp.]
MSRKAGIIITLFLAFLVIGSLAYRYSDFLEGLVSEEKNEEKEIELYSLVNATEHGIVNTEFRGMGLCSADSILMKIKSEVEYEIEIEIEPGWVLINSGSGQNMITVGGLTITVEPEIEKNVKIEAYCLDIDLDNPSFEETLSLQTNLGAYGSEAVELMAFVSNTPKTKLQWRSVQIALWVLLDDVSTYDLMIEYSDYHIQNAKWLLEKIKVDTSEKRIFRQTSYPNESPLKLTQYTCFETHIIGEVENVGNDECSAYGVYAWLYDDDGWIRWEIEDEGCTRLTIPPGEKSPFHIDGSYRSFTNGRAHEVRLWSYSGSTFAHYQMFEVSNVSVEEEDATLYIRGEVKNVGNENVVTTKVVVSIYDEKGNLVGCSQSKVLFFDSGETFPFEMTSLLTGTFDHWIIYVDAWYW